MGSQRRIYLDLLDDVDSWTLFRKHANIDDDMSSETKKNVCKECKGLPIAITAVGSSLKGKSNAEWEVALSRLMHSEATDDDMEEGLRDVYRCLKLSYDYLKNKEAELLFLLCSMYPKDHKIQIEDLIRYAIGLGLGGRLSLELVRSQIQAGINKLLDSCLLLHENFQKGNVRMHDMVRGAALWIAGKLKDHQILFNHDKPLGTVVMDRKIEDYFAISSWCIENQISFELDAPNLQILLLDMRVKDSLNLSHVTFKESDNKLKVFAVLTLDQEHSYSPRLPLLSLPHSIKEWTNLQTVRLNGQDLGDLSFITSLTGLEVLDLQWCTLNELPIQMGRLKRLKMLDLSHCTFQGNYNGAIGKCLQLEELYAYKCNPRYLYESIPDIVTHLKLQRFVIGHFLGDRPLGFRAVELEDLDISKLRTSGSNILQVAEVIYLSFHCISGCKNVIPDLIRVAGDMNNLISLSLVSEKEIEYIFDATSDSDHQVDASIKLVDLWLSSLPSLKELFRGPPQHFFEKLEKLYMWECRQLHTIFPMECNLQNLKILSIRYCTIGEEILFSMSVAQSLQHLEELSIEGVDGLKHIIGSGRGYDSTTSKQLFLAPSNSCFLMPNLKKVEVIYCSKVESLFPICCCVEGLFQLEEISIWNVPELKYVFGECNHMDHSSVQYQNQIMLPHLKKFGVWHLKNLVDMCPKNYLAKWPTPSEIEVEYCPKFNGMARLRVETFTSK